MSISQNFPNEGPTLSLNFASSKTLDPRITFVRASIGTYFDDNGQLVTAPANAPRFDHNPTTGESLGLLVEEARTNLQTNSENIASLGTLLGSTITSNAITAPDGQTTADKLIEDTSTGGHQVSGISISWAGNTTYTVSIYAKADTRTVLTVAFGTSSYWVNSSRTATFNLLNGTISSTSGTPVVASIQTLPNGWYRCILSATTVAAPGASTLVIQLNNGSTTSYTGDNTSGLFLWGAQLEAAAFPTSYIPTTTSTVTRAADVASIDGSNYTSWANNNEGTIFSDSSIIASQIKTQTVWELSGGTALSSLRQPQETANQFRAVIGGTFTGSPGTGANLTTGVTLAAVAYSGTAGRLQIGSVGTDATGSTLDATSLSIGSLAGGSQLNGRIKRITYYPTRLPNTTLQTLTK